MHIPKAALTLTALLLVFTLGCKDSGSGSGDSDLSGYNGLAVRAVNTGSGDLEISQDGEASNNFCYEEDGCGTVTGGGGSFHTIFEDQESIIDLSDPDEKAVGIEVAFHVDAGSGMFEIVAGEAYRDDAGFLEFEPGEVVYTSDEFSAETIVRYEYGETD